MRYLLKYFKGYIKEVIIAPLFKLTEAGFELLVPLIVAAMIDVGITNNDTPYIIKCAFILVLLGAVGLTVAITAQYFAAKAAVGFSCRIRRPGENTNSPTLTSICKNAEKHGVSAPLKKH